MTLYSEGSKPCTTEELCSVPYNQVDYFSYERTQLVLGHTQPLI
jgi:hypothetical protein